MQILGMEEKLYKTNYNTEWKIDVSNKDALDGIRVEDRLEYFVDSNGMKYSTTDIFDSYSEYAKTTISKNNFNRILGEDGKISIYNQSGDLITEINKNTALDSNENYSFTYTEGVDKIIIETSKPVAEGTLYLKHIRVMEETLPYTKEQLQNFKSLEEKINLIQIENNNYMTLAENTLTYNLEETYTNANIILDRTTLSTIINNEDIEIKIVLDNLREDSDLYIDPVFLIELPEYIENIDIKEANILFNQNLEIQNIEKIEEDGNTYIKISLQGMQNGFSTGKFTNGTNIVLKTNIQAKLLTPSIDDKINLYYINPNAMSYKNPVQLDDQILGMSTQDISYSTPTGMLAVTNISEYGNGKSVTSVGQGTLTDKIGIYESAKVAKMEVKLVNNTGNECDSLVTLGRLPFKGNKNIQTNEDLGTTMDATLKTKFIASGIPQENATIYYSENGEATENLNDVNNAWTQEPQDLSKVKSYLITINDYKMQSGEEIDFAYNFEIPENLEYGSNFNTTFKTSYTNNTNAGPMQEIVTADTVGLTTGQGPKLSLEQNVITDNNVVEVGQIVKVRACLENTGDEDAENIVLREYIPKYTKYTKYQEPEGHYAEVEGGYVYPATEIEEGTKKEYVDFLIGELKVGEFAYVEFELYIDQIPTTIYEYYEGTPGLVFDGIAGKYYIDTYAEDGEEVLSSEEITKVPDIKFTNDIAVFAKDLEKPLTNSSDEIKIEKSFFKVEEKSTMERIYPLEEGKEIAYNIDITNISSETLTNVIAEKNLPNGLELKSAYVLKYNKEKNEWENDIEASYENNNRLLKFNIGTMANSEIKRLKVVAVTEKIEDGKYENELKTKTTVTAENATKFTGPEVVNTVAKPNLQTKITSDIVNEYISEGDKITYTIIVKNAGKYAAADVCFTDKLPSELKFVSASYKASVSKNTGKLKSANNEITLIANIQPDEELEITIVAQAKNLPNDLQEATITNYATFIGTNTPLVVTKELKTIIEQSATLPNPPNNSSNTNGNGNNGGSYSDSSNPKYFRIRGSVFVDANANGARDTDEKTLDGIQVMLANATTGEIVKDRTTQEEKKTTTANNGAYVFENLEAGDYIVIFYYDNQIYALTDYKKSGVSESINSDVISSKITMNGEQKEAAVTDLIRLKTSSYANIDMGLINTKKFDLNLKKYMAKITVQNKDGVKSYNYNNTSLGKVEIKGKKMIGSTIVAEYKITVTNEGNVPGYVKNIVDYMPKEMKFNSSLNPNWYAGNDGNLYTTQLANQIINPGETKEIRLVLTKQLTEGSGAIINNLAEIYESYNELGLADIDSTAKNKAQGEDDIGSADLLIAVKTGEAVTYIGITVISLIILATGIYIIRKKYSKYYN